MYTYIQDTDCDVKNIYFLPDNLEPRVRVDLYPPVSDSAVHGATVVVTSEDVLTSETPAQVDPLLQPDLHSEDRLRDRGGSVINVILHNLGHDSARLAS